MVGSLACFSFVAQESLLKKQTVIINIILLLRKFGRIFMESFRALVGFLLTKQRWWPRESHGTLRTINTTILRGVPCLARKTRHLRIYGSSFSDCTQCAISSTYSTYGSRKHGVLCKRSVRLVQNVPLLRKSRYDAYNSYCTASLAWHAVLDQCTTHINLARTA
jgi:hypothetical protein